MKSEILHSYQDFLIISKIQIITRHRQARRGLETSDTEPQGLSCHIRSHSRLTLTYDSLSNVCNSHHLHNRSFHVQLVSQLTCHFPRGHDLKIHRFRFVQDKTPRILTAFYRQGLNLFSKESAINMFIRRSDRFSCLLSFLGVELQQRERLNCGPSLLTLPFLVYDYT